MTGTEFSNSAKKIILGLDDMLKLQDDWDSCGSKAPTTRTIEIVRSIILKNKSELLPEIYPEQDGSIGLYWETFGGDTYIVYISDKAFPLGTAIKENEHGSNKLGSILIENVKEPYWWSANFDKDS